ncbi:MAG: META domain-containing protein [Pseudomonadota bacterium]
MTLARHLAISLVLLTPALQAAPTPNPLPAPLPATFVGTLPCADCPGIDTKLNLLPDGQFQMRMTYLERPGAGFDSIGLWQVHEGKLLLKEGAQTVEQFQIKAKPASLIKLDMQGQPIASKLDYSLKPKGVFQPMKPKLTMQGMFVYFADSARFTPCATGQSMPVKMEGEYLALEKAYMATRKEPQQALLATVEGQISKQPRMEGEGSEQVLRVLKLVEMSAASACPAPDADKVDAPRLEDRTWVLVQLGEQNIAPPKQGLGAHLILMSKDQRVAGSGGCNRLMGGYTLQGDTLKFGQMASSMMFCENGMETEQGFVLALSKVAGWSMDSGLLVLKDSGGKVLAKLRADESSKP